MRTLGSASRARAAGSVAADRARTRPTAAEPRVNGRERASISTRGARIARPSDRLMTAKMHRSATTVLPRMAIRAASQSHIPTPGPESRVKTPRSEEHTSELQSRQYLVCRLLLEKKKQQ